MSRASPARLRRRLLDRMGHTLYYASSISWRDAIAAVETIGQQMRSGRTYAVDVGHAEACACRHGTAPLERCSCSVVELHVFEVRA
jgi:hypothetical protein